MGDYLLDSLIIEGFRGFKRLEIEKFAAVNLIVGKNSVGKSSLLEAIQLYVHQGHPTIILQTLGERQEVKARREWQIREPDLVDYEIMDVIQGIRHLFFGRPSLELPFLEQLQLHIKGGKQPDLNIQLTTSPKANGQNGTPSPQAPDWAIEIHYGDTPPLRYGLINFFTGSNFSLISSFKPPSKLIFIPAQDLTQRDTNFYWSQIALKAEETKVTEALNFIVPNLSRFSFIDDEAARERIAIAVVNNQRVPLKSLGEGVNRLLGLALAIVNVPNGILLVDEIGSGLHYSVQTKMWEFLMTLANEMNVQIFATTHSNDCVKAFEYVSNQLADVEGQIIRLEKWEEEMTAVVIDENVMEVAFEERIEVR
ncbi:MAG: AAA family ATPase [Chloroflexi bacterium]|nr:AAA family ATPase [Chloroflexota bacterium]